MNGLGVSVIIRKSQSPSHMPALSRGRGLAGTHQNPREGDRTGSIGADSPVVLGRRGLQESCCHWPSPQQGGPGTLEQASTSLDRAHDDDPGQGDMNTVILKTDKNLALGELPFCWANGRCITYVKGAPCQIGSTDESAPGRREWFAILNRVVREGLPEKRGLWEKDDGSEVITIPKI